MVAEVEPIGGFVGASVSEPLLQGGVMISVLAYMIHLDLWMALIAVAIFVPQLVFVPLMQKAIIERTADSPQLAADAAFPARFQREIEILRQLDHPNIVRFLESGAHEGHSYFAMEYIDGESLRRVLPVHAKFVA